MRVDDIVFLLHEEIDKIKKSSDAAKPFKVNAYLQVIKKIEEAHRPTEVMTNAKIQRLDITRHMRDNLATLSKKTLTDAMKKRRAAHKLLTDLDKFLGIGPSKARKLIDLGLTSIRQLRLRKWFDMLGADTQLMLIHRPLRRVPYECVKQLKPKLTGFRGAEVLLVGSFRRKKEFMRDIDVMVVSDKLNVLDLYIGYLFKKFNKKVYVYSHGNDKMSLIIQPSTSEHKYKVDVFRTSVADRHAMLLYSTGSKAFNIRMRRRAKAKGLLLNQRGLFKDGEQINTPSDTEQRLFAMVDMSYVVPEKRK